MTAFAIPTLEAERFVLRAYHAKDHPRVADYFTDPDSRFTSGPQDPVEAWQSMCAHAGAWVLRGFGMWVIADKGDDRYLGIAGGSYPFDWPEKEIGWSLHPDARGRGFATEAVKMVRQWLYRHCGWTTAVSYVDPKNASSIRVAKRVGAVREAEITLRGKLSLVFRHPAPGNVAETETTRMSGAGA